MQRRSLLGALTLPGWAPSLGRAATEPGVTPRELIVGQSLALGGGANPYAVEVQAGIAAALKPVQAAGGIFGRRIVLRTLDDRNDSTQATAHARRLIDEGAFILFGSIEGGPSSAVAAVAESARVPFFGPMAGSPGLRRPHKEMVFPVRAEHRDEFRALIGWGRSTGLTTMALMHSDSDVGREHLLNTQLLGDELGTRLAYGLPFKGNADDAALKGMVEQLRREPVQFVLNHGSPDAYGRLIRMARAVGVDSTFMGVNSGSTQLARSLGPLGRGMVFAQVMPNPWSKKTALVRDYQLALEAAYPGRERSYASLEGFATAQALVVALRAAGAQPTRLSLVRALEATEHDLGGISMNWRPRDHAGSRFVDLAMVTREGTFMQ